MTILELSASGAVLIAVVLLLRLALLHRLPKWTFLLLWAVALCRLLIPFRVPSPISFYTGTAQVVQAAPEPVPTVPVSDPEPTKPPVRTGPAAPAADTPEEETVFPLPVIYGTGVTLCGLFFAASYLRGLRRFRGAVPAEGDFILRWRREHPTLFPVQIKTCGGVRAPLAYGLLRPVILLPETTDWSDEEGLTYILTHEYVHIRREDTLWKLLLTAAACVHWFNPLVWVMFLCANGDLELACDEAVVGILGPDRRKGYALALLQTEEDLYSAYRSKSALEERITAIMRTTRRPVWAVLAALLLVAGVAAVFATSRVPLPGSRQAGKAEVWVDYAEENLPWDERKTLELSEFPGVVFTWTAGTVTAETERGEIVLLHGMPIENVFLCDLTGDGLPEFCATVAFGSGMVDYHVLVCDFAAAVRNPRRDDGGDEYLLLNQAQYALWDRGGYDYVLSLEDSRLRVAKTPYPHLWDSSPHLDEEPVTGDLVLTDGGRLQIAQKSDGTRPPVVLHGDRPVDRGPEAPEGLWLEVVKNSATPCGLDYVVHNQSGYRVSYGADDYRLEVEEGGMWYAVLTGKRWRVSQLEDDAPEGGDTSGTHAIDWTDYYGELFPGHYRIVKDVSVTIDDREESYHRSYALTAEFEVGSAGPPAARVEESEEPIVPDQTEGVWMEAVKDTVTPSGMEYTVHNETGRELLYGEPYSLQVEKNGAWSAVDLADGNEDMYFLAIGYGLDGVEQTSESRTVDWSHFYGELSPGHYRMVKSTHLGPAREPVTLAAEFEIEA